MFCLLGKKKTNI
uniref:Uncharacterized protein n=1 Tax=Anguilla anguilla TaxID=7936 RepID=A0A0E9U843_ANGAN